jgi:hypothetical protein
MLVFSGFLTSQIFWYATCLPPASTHQAGDPVVGRCADFALLASHEGAYIERRYCMLRSATMIPRAGIPSIGKAAQAAASTNGFRSRVLRSIAASRLTRTIFCCSIAAVVIAATASSASAVTMFNFGGAWGGVDPLSASTSNLTDGFAISPGTAGSLLTGGVVNDLTLNATGFTGVINGASGPVTLSRLSVTSGAGTAVFDLIAPQLSQFQFALPSGPFGVGAIVAGVLLNPGLTTPGLLTELAPFAVPGGSLVVTYNGLTVSSAGGGTIVHGPSPTASFTVTAVPEASSVVLATSGALCLVGYMWRRRLAGNRTATAETAS